MSLRGSCRWWKISQPNDEKTKVENRTRDQSMKNLLTDEGDWGEKPKDQSVDIVDEKTFQPGQRTGKKKPRLMWREGTWFGRWRTWIIRDLVKIRIPPYCLFFVTSFLSSHLARFLARLVGRPRFCLAGSLTIGLVIGGKVSMVGEVTVGLSGCALWNELMSFLRCWTAEAGSQVFSSSGYPFHETW